MIVDFGMFVDNYGMEVIIILKENMFDRMDREIKVSDLMQERTGSQFSENGDDSVVYEVEAERQYVSHLKVQR